MDDARRQPTVLHLDDHLVVVDKPSGLAVHRSDQVRDRHVALTLVRDTLDRHVHPVHRLDRGTSGVLVFALDPATASALGRAFQADEVEKRYLALVRGVPTEGLVDHPVPKARKSAERLPARTKVGVVASADWRDRTWSWVEARPETGRTHQIRRHLKHLSCPLVGDVHYGKGDVNRLFREELGLHRLALHAASISFRHPASGERIEVAAGVPAELVAALDALGLTVG